MRANTHCLWVLLEVTSQVLFGNHTIRGCLGKVAVLLSHIWPLMRWSDRLIKEALVWHRLYLRLHKIDSDITRPVGHERSSRLSFLASPTDSIIELFTLNL